MMASLKGDFTFLFLFFWGHTVQKVLTMRFECDFMGHQGERWPCWQLKRRLTRGMALVTDCDKC